MGKRKGEGADEGQMKWERKGWGREGGRGKGKEEGERGGSQRKSFNYFDFMLDCSEKFRSRFKGRRRAGAAATERVVGPES